MFISYLGLWYSGFRVFEGTPYDPLDSAVSIALGVSMIAFFATGAALPALVWMARRGPLSLGRVVALGAVLGNVPFVLIVASIFVVQLFRGTLSSDVARFWYGASGARSRSACRSVPPLRPCSGSLGSGVQRSRMSGVCRPRMGLAHAVSDLSENSYFFRSSHISALSLRFASSSSVSASQRANERISVEPPLTIGTRSTLSTRMTFALSSSETEVP